MNIENYIRQMKEIQNAILECIDDESFNEENNKKLNNLLEEQSIKDKPNELKSILYILSKIANNHNRATNFFSKIERILKIFKEEMKEYFTNPEIFNIFKGNKRILLYLIKENIIIINKSVINILRQKNYIYYFYPEIDQIDSEIFDRKYIKKIIEDSFDIYEEKRKIGENDSYLCELIRNDSIDEFIQYLNENKRSPTSIIEPSIFETNSFLINKKISLIEYSAFFGSIKIIHFLLSNKIELNSSLLLFAIHSQNLELIQNIEQQISKQNDNFYEECLIESIKCHHNKITDYFLNKFVKKNEIECLKYYNFNYFNMNFIDKSIFHNLCKYDYSFIIKNLFDSSEFDLDLNEKIFQRKIKIESDEKEMEIIEYEKTALLVSVEKGNIQVVNLLLSHKDIDVNVKSECKHFYFYGLKTSEKTALHAAIENENCEIVELLIDKKDADLNIKMINKYEKGNNYKHVEEKPSLFVAIEKENTKIINFLLARKEIDVNSKFISKEEAASRYYIEKSPLHLAVEKENQLIVQSLLTVKEINVNDNFIESYVSDSNSYSREKQALHIAAYKNNCQIVNMLLQCERININAKMITNYEKSNEFSEKTAFHIAICKGYKQIVELLLKHPGIDVNVRKVNESYEKTPLFITVENEYNEIAEVLLQNQNLDINMTSKIKHVKLNEEEEEEYNENVKQINEEEMKALHLAVDIGNLYIIKLLLKHPRIDVNNMLIKKFINNEDSSLDEIRKTALHVAVEQNKTEIVNALLSNPNIDVNIRRFHHENKITSEGELNTYSEEYESALSIAISKRYVNIVKILLAQPNIDVNVKRIESIRTTFIDSFHNTECDMKKEDTPLHTAVQNNDILIAKLLLQDSKIDVNALSVQTKTFCKDNDEEYQFEAALHIAIENNYKDIVDLLLANPNIDINLISMRKESEGNELIEEKKTSLHLAVDKQNIDFVSLLLKHPKIDANIFSFKKVAKSDDKDTFDEIERTALHQAVEQNDIIITDMLLNSKNINVNVLQITRKIVNSVLLRKMEEAVLHAAVEKNNYNIVELLCKNPEIDVNAFMKITVAIEGSEYVVTKASLHLSVLLRYIEIIKILLKNPKIDINIKDNEGKSPCDQIDDEQIVSLFEMANSF